MLCFLLVLDLKSNRLPYFSLCFIAISPHRFTRENLKFLVSSLKLHKKNNRPTFPMGPCIGSLGNAKAVSPRWLTVTRSRIRQVVFFKLIQLNPLLIWGEPNGCCWIKLHSFKNRVNVIELQRYQAESCFVQGLVSHTLTPEKPSTEQPLFRGRQRTKGSSLKLAGNSWLTAGDCLCGCL